MWGSYFSRKDGEQLSRPFRRVWSRVSLVIGPPVPAAEADALLLSQRVAHLGGMVPPPAVESVAAVAKVSSTATFS